MLIYPVFTHVRLRFLYFPSSFVSPFECNDWVMGAEPATRGVL